MAFEKLRYELRNMLINRRNRKKLLNAEFTMLSNDCVSGMIYHDLGLRFETPLINMYMNAEDYIKFLKNLKGYINENFEEISEFDYDYPMAMLGDIKLHLVHYSSFQEARKKWNERKKRIKFDNLYIMMNDRNGCTDEIAKEFDELPYENKIFFTNNKNSNLKYGKYIPHFDNKESVGVMVKYTNKFSIKRYYDYFDYISWLNNGK